MVTWPGFSGQAPQFWPVSRRWISRTRVLLVDGGIRLGTSILKAPALGGSAGGTAVLEQVETDYLPPWPCMGVPASSRSAGTWVTTVEPVSRGASTVVAMTRQWLPCGGFAWPFAVTTAVIGRMASGLRVGVPWIGH